MTTLLKVENLHSYIQQFHVLQGVNFTAEKGEATVILGRNGVGKTALFRSILGILKPAEGHIFFDGREITGMPTYKIVRRGVCLVPSSRSVFTNLTVKENLGIAYRGDKGEFPGQALEHLRDVPRARARVRQKRGKPERRGEGNARNRVWHSQQGRDAHA